MKIVILSDHCLGGGKDVFAGDVIDLPENAARVKIARGWARAADQPGDEIGASEDVPAADLPGESSEPSIRRGRTRGR